MSSGRGQGRRSSTSRSPPILTIDEAIAADSFHSEPHFIRRGDVDGRARDAPLTLEGEFEHRRAGAFLSRDARGLGGARAKTARYSSAHRRSIPRRCSRSSRTCSHLPRTAWWCNARAWAAASAARKRRATLAALVALAALKTGRTVRVRFDRDQDMMLTGQTPSVPREVRGRLRSRRHAPRGAECTLFPTAAGRSISRVPITDRALFHLDNAYYIPHVEFSGRVAKTNLASNTAFRGFGGPQGMLVIEEIIDRIARATGLAPEVVRERNLYRGTGETNTTHYGQEIEDNRIQRIWQRADRRRASSRRGARNCAPGMRSSRTESAGSPSRR